MPTRFVILADVHLGLPETQFPNQDYTYATDLLRRAVELIQPLKPQKVIVLGDLVNMGSAEEHRLAREIFGPLAGRLEMLLGNHELLRGMISDWRLAWNQTPFRISQMESLPVVYLNSGIEHLPDSEYRGRLDLSQYELLRSAIGDNPDKPLIVFCHHPLAGTVRRSDLPMFGLDDTAEVLQILSQHTHDVVLFTGHTHYQSVVRRGNITCIACPPLCFWPHGFLVVDLDERSLRFSTTRLFASHEHSPIVKSLIPNIAPEVRACRQINPDRWN